MDGNSTIGRRYSFNIAQTIPVAESTQLGSSFSWGSSPSMVARSHSSICLNSSPISKNITKIDARIAADVQSNGLTSRIVKYHESGARLNRSLSARNLYTRPGQFPAVTLKKTELPYRAKKQDLSMIRIPPPEKSTFYGNTISSLLKSNSVVGLKPKRTEDNRPIIHPPPSENDLAPTRSVLEVLKEISRKRINSDDLEADESSKKYCNRGVCDFINAATCTASTNSVANVSTATSQRFKRQRDRISPHQSVHGSEEKTTPEQAKKRICNYNNDITSSLSSSVKVRCNEKRKASFNLDQTESSNSETYETQKRKIHRCLDQTDVSLKSLVNYSGGKAESVTPITSVPTPCDPNEGKTCIVGPKPISDSSHSSNGKALQCKIRSEDNHHLTLFNKKYESEAEKEKECVSKTDEKNNIDEYVGISFVKPKKMASSGLKNPVTERAQKSKLALMLSGLRGEIYQYADKYDDNTSKKEHEKVEEKKLKDIEKPLISATKSVSTVTTTLTTTVASSSNLNLTTGILTTTGTTNLNTSNITDVGKTNTTSNKTSSPLVGLKLTQIKSSSTNDTAAASANDTKTSATNSSTNIPVLGGFSLNIPSTSISAAAFTTVTSTKSSVNSTLTVSKANNLVMNGEPKSNFSIGLSLPTTKDSALSFPVISTNSMNSNENKSLLSNISLSTTNPIKPVDTFTFGSNVTPITTTHNTLKTVESGSQSFSNNGTAVNSSQPLKASPTSTIFGSLATSTTKSTNAFNTAFSNTTAGGISFGTVTTTSTVTSIAPTITTFSLNPSKTSAPIAVTNIPTDSSSTSTFKFSSQPPTTNAFTFSANNNNTENQIQSSNSLFSFGSISKTQNSASDDKNSSNCTPENKNFAANTSSPFFGSSNLKGLNSAPLTDNSTNNTEKNAFATPSFVFGGSNSLKNDSQIFGSNADNKSTSFGGNTTNNSTPTLFSFGAKPSGTQTDNNPNPSGGFSFGSNVARSSDGGAFGFGNTIAPKTTKESNNVFGTVSSNALESKTFTFGSTNKNENNTASSGGFSFNTASTQKPTTFSFSATGNSTSGFSFGGVTSPLPTSINKTFSFGTPQPQASQASSTQAPNSVSSNIFGLPAPSKTVPQPTFNFNPGNSTNLQQTVQPTNNIFAPPVSNIAAGGSGDRPIRRATRRLQK